MPYWYTLKIRVSSIVKSKVNCIIVGFGDESGPGPYVYTPNGYRRPVLSRFGLCWTADDSQVQV